MTIPRRIRSATRSRIRGSVTIETLYVMWMMSFFMIIYTLVFYIQLTGQTARDNAHRQSTQLLVTPIDTSNLGAVITGYITDQINSLVGDTIGGILSELLFGSTNSQIGSMPSVQVADHLDSSGFPHKPLVWPALAKYTFKAPFIHLNTPGGGFKTFTTVSNHFLMRSNWARSFFPFVWSQDYLERNKIHDWYQAGWDHSIGDGVTTALRLDSYPF